MWGLGFRVSGSGFRVGGHAAEVRVWRGVSQHHDGPLTTRVHKAGDQSCQ